MNTLPGLSADTALQIADNSGAGMRRQLYLLGGTILLRALPCHIHAVSLAARPRYTQPRDVPHTDTATTVGQLDVSPGYLHWVTEHDKAFCLVVSPV